MDRRFFATDAHGAALSRNQSSIFTTKDTKGATRHHEVTRRIIRGSVAKVIRGFAPAPKALFRWRPPERFSKTVPAAATGKDDLECVETPWCDFV